MNRSEQYLDDIRQHKPLPASSQTRLILSLSWPAILAQLSVTIMQLIDSGMTGRLGPDASAAIGLVSSSTWLINGICIGAVYGFSVQVAQKIGASLFSEAKNLCRQGFYLALSIAIVIAAIGSLLSTEIPVWLHGEPELLGYSRAYLRIFCLSLPFVVLNSWCVQMLQAAGNTKLPGMTQIVMCFLDVAFNAFFIYGLHLGVAGAALGTAAAEVCSSLFLSFIVFCRNPFLKGSLSVRFHNKDLKQAARIGIPISIEQLISGSSYVAFTRIVSSVGSIALAANSFAITVESLCYMPAYGCAAAATTIIGQCVGADREKMAKEISARIAKIGILMGIVTGVVLFILSPFLLSLLTPYSEIISLATIVLRMEAFAEPLYAASIVVVGILRGKGDTFWPAVLTFLSIWCIRIPLAVLLCSRFGLPGAWMAMVIELCLRGTFFLIRLHLSWRNNRHQSL